MFRLPRACVPLHASHRNGVSGHRGAGLGAGRAGDAPKHISSRSAHAPQTCLRWAVRAGMGMLPPDPNSPRRSFACPLGCAMPGGRSGGCESVLIHRFHPWHTTRAYACHTTNGPMMLRGLVRRPGTTIYRARSPSRLARTIGACRAATFGLAVTGVPQPAFAVTAVFLGCAGAGSARFATFLRSADCTALPDGGSNRPNPYLLPQHSPGKIVGSPLGPLHLRDLGSYPF